MALLAVIGAVAAVRRRRDHAGDFRAQRRRGAGDRQSATGAACAAAHLRHSRRAVRDPAARDRRHRQALRPGDGGLVRRRWRRWASITSSRSRRSSAALSPHHGAAFFLRHGIHGMLILGSVVLAVTGGEALYADMGHFGVRPIRLAWTFFVLPSLVLGYLGQGALILRDPSPSGIENPFYVAWCPPGVLTYLLVAAVERRHRDRVAGPDLRGLLADPPGDAAGLSAARDDQAHRLSHRGADLHPGGQQPAGGRLHRAGADVSRVGEAGRGLRHRRDRNHGDHLDPLLHRGAAHLGLEPVEGRRAARPVPELSIFPFWWPISSSSSKAVMCRC